MPNIFCALPIDTVAHARRWVTSILAVIPWDLKAFLTPFRTEDFAPHLLCSVDSEGYFPYESDFGLLAFFAALWMPEMLATRPICSGAWSSSKPRPPS